MSHVAVTPLIERKKSFRTDIQALRGVAVLLVVIYHSGVGIFQAGYLGVDMFFVISGFLITGIITRGIVADRFSFAGFYTRRARRVLPAAYAMLTATSVAAYFLLTSTQYEAFFTNLAGSLIFGANFTLWLQTGYFAPDSAFQPLLHMWSLAIEEQYYLLVPIVLVILPRRTWLPALSAATLDSLAACLYLAATKPSIAFFWLPPRAWELGLGSLAALTWEREAVRRIAQWLLWPAVVGLALTPIWPLPGPTPGLGSILICLSAAIIIIARDERAHASAMLRGLAFVGDFSYSLYLVHWPLFALVRATRLSTELDPLLSVGLIAGSFVLAIILYRFVEEPIRQSSLGGRKLVLVSLAVPIAVLALGGALAASKPHILRKSGQEQPVAGLAGCFSEDERLYKGTCTQSATPEVLLWGDSYSAHLVPGLQATSRHSFAQASKGMCSPLLDYAAVGHPNEVDFAKGCIAYNDSVLAYIRRTPSLKIVILAGQYFRSMPGASVFALRRLPGGNIVRAPLGTAPTVAAQQATVARLRSYGLRVITVSTPPPSDFDLGKCWERKAERLPIAGPAADCVLRDDNPQRALEGFEAMMSGFTQSAHVPVVRLDRALCHAGRCDIAQDGKPLFRDNGHLTTWGSLVVGRRVDLGERAWRDAR